MSDVGRLIADRYRLTEHIGSGAMGTVWQAHDERLHRTVALKQLLLSPGLSAAEAHEARERAMREGRIAARLQHPNAVTVYDVVEDAGQPVLIMEYVPSRSLSAVMDQRGPLAPQEVARIGAQVATALTAAHAAGIVHRDIKPGNVLLAEDGTVKITDFGISRATGDVTVTATGMLAGTPAYLAPEVAKGEIPGPPSDVFSLASTVYAAVEGAPPFGLGDNTLAILHAVAACRTIPPRQAGPLTALLMHMLRANPDDRPTMSEVNRALTAIANGQVPTGAGTPPSGLESGPMSDPTVRTWPQQHPQSQPGSYPVPHPVPTMQQPMTPPRPQPARPRPAQPAQAPAWRKPVLTALAIIVAALLGILVANAFVNTGGSHAAADEQVLRNSVAAGPPSGLPTPQAAPQPPAYTTTASQTTLLTPPPAGTPTAQQNAQQEVAVLRAYVGLLPHHPMQAWTLLTPAAQARSGGYATYQRDWSAVRTVSLDQPTPQGADAILARVGYTTVTGQSGNDPYLFGFAPSAGRLLINSITPAAKPPQHG